MSKGIRVPLQHIPRNPPTSVIQGLIGRGIRDVGLNPVGRALGHPNMPPPPVGWVAISATSGNAFFAILNGPPEPVGIEAGWEEIERQKQKNALWHKGSPLEGWVLHVLFDRYRQQASVENECAQLKAMTARLGGEDPPAVRVSGIGPIATNRDWVVTDVEPNDDPQTLWHPSRVRLRAAFDVTITERVLPNLVVVKPAKSTRTKRGAKKTRIYTVKAGDANLQRIALRELGNVARWREIKSSAGKAIKDPKRITVGQKLRLP
jgi:hypothetical protein